jgi:hypothetical protein
LQLRHSEECCTHQSDNKGSNKSEDSLPDIFCPRPLVFSKAIEGPDETGTNDETYDQAYAGPIPDL